MRQLPRYVCFLTVFFTTALFALPEGIYPEWNLEKAWKSTSATRTRYCLNGLWQWRSASESAAVPPAQSDSAAPVWKDPIERDGATEWVVDPVPKFPLSITFDPGRTSNKESRASLKIDVAAPAHANLYHAVRIVRGLPTNVPLRLEFDVINQVKGGNISVELQDLLGFRNYDSKGPNIKTGSEWTTYSMDFILPGKCKGIKLIPMRNLGDSAKELKGSLWIDNLRITRKTATQVQGSPLPTDDDWGYAVIPASFTNQLFWPHGSDPFGNKPQDAARVWFRRTVDIPQEWAGRRIVLHFNAVATDAFVYIDRRLAGKVGFDGGDVDITPYIKPGQKVSIAVNTVWRPLDQIFPLLMQGDQRWMAHGLNGDVFLSSEPCVERIGNGTIVTEVTPAKVLKFTSPISRPKNSSARPLQWECQVRDGDRVVLSFKGTLLPSQNRLQAIALWPDAICWEPDSPKLYDLQVTLRDGDKIVDQSLPIRFGFREFKIQGKFFVLNGIKLNLVPCAYWAIFNNWDTMAAMRHWVKGARRAGYNFVYTDELNFPGRPDVLGHFLTVCDEEGMLVAGDTIRCNQVIDSFDDKAVQAEFLRIIGHAVLPNLNHPSLIMWRMNMNANLYGQDQNPYFLDGKKPFTAGSNCAQREQMLIITNRLLRSLDPNRPIYNHACGRTGEIYTANNYLGWPELQDLREWLRVWAENADKPIFMSEQATPYPGDFTLRNRLLGWFSEPLMTECAAMLLGDKAYRLEEDDFTDFVSGMWDAKTRKWRNPYFYYTYHFPPLIDICTAKYYEAMLPAWRTWGISGGINAWENPFRRLKKWNNPMPPVSVPIDWARLQIPGFVSDKWYYDGGAGGEIRTLFDLGIPKEKEYFEPTLRATVMPRLIAPLYAYIGGPVKRWYTVEHSYRSGECVRKTVVLINDLRNPAIFDIIWKVVAKGREIAGGKARATVQPACSDKVEFSFDAPAVAERTDAQITATVTAGGKPVSVNPFDLQIFPVTEKSTSPLEKWAIFDPQRRSASALARLGFKMTQIQDPAKLPDDLDVLVIGSLGLKDGAHFPGLDARIRNGLKVLVFEQDEKTLQERFGFRTQALGFRHVEVRMAKHPVLEGLSAVDLRDWRGWTSLAPVKAPPQSLDDSQLEQNGWCYSAEGIVASAMVEKPHAVGYRPILDGGFDLRYMALWEVADKKGLVVFCQLDVTDRAGLDSVADRMIRNLVGYLQNAKPENENPLVVELDPKSDYTAEQLRRQLGEGATILATGCTPATLRALATVSGATFQTATRWKNALDSAELPDAFAGISPAGVHWRIKCDVSVITQVPAGGWKSPSGVLAVIPAGKGKIVWLSTPDREFTRQERPDLAFSQANAWRLRTLVKYNAGMNVGNGLLPKLLSGDAKPDGKRLYNDRRTPNDDPYTYIRW
ncbi:MAG: sugar-binding domain-containing protein [Anaerovoracaceae bacterium]